MEADGAALCRLHELCFEGWDDDVALSPTLLLRLLLTVLRCEDEESFGQVRALFVSLSLCLSLSPPPLPADLLADLPLIFSRVFG